MNSRRFFYGIFALATTVSLLTVGYDPVRAQDPASATATPAPSDAALNDPMSAAAAAAQAQALQNVPSLPGVTPEQQAQIEAQAAAETGLAPAQSVPGTALPSSPAQQAQDALSQTATSPAATGQVVQEAEKAAQKIENAVPTLHQMNSSVQAAEQSVNQETATATGDQRPVVPLAAPTDSPEARAAAQQATNDALPISRMRIQTEGFGLGAQRNIDVYPGDNPGDDVDNAALQAEIRQEAYDAATTGLFPLEPDQIRALLRQYDDTERAAQSPPYNLPTPEVVVQTVSMDPGVAPPVIKTAVGHVTTVNMLDLTGAPWPVQDITWAGDFEIVEPEEGGHIIRITPMGKFTYGNMAVRLLTLKTPITFSLRVERDTVHYRVDARIPEYGPFAQAQLMEGSTQLAAGNSTLTSVLDGVAPTGSVRLAVAGADGRTTAYKVGPMTYVRTPLTLLSPGWQSSVSSADGMNVYALEDTPVLLLSDQGKFLRAKLSEQKDLFDDQ